MEKMQGGTPGHGSMRSVLMSKEYAMSKIVYSVEKCVLTVKTLYQTSSLVTLGRQFWNNFKMRQEPEGSVIICPVQMSE
jgi:hypothetical protein